MLRKIQGILMEGKCFLEGLPIKPTTLRDALNWDFYRVMYM